MFVHLIDGEGNIVAQSDHQPADGLAPTSIWAPGMTVHDTHILTLPADLPPGRYRLLVGMYDAQTNQRLPITDTQLPGFNDAILLEEVVVGRGT